MKKFIAFGVVLSALIPMVGFSGAGGIAGSSGGASVSAADIDFHNKPLFLSDNAEPNIVITIDDSLNMMKEVYGVDEGTANFVFPAPYDATPARVDVYDSTTLLGNTVFFQDSQDYLPMRSRSSDFNLAYYNPAIRYYPWVNEDGTPYRTSASGTYNNDGAATYDHDGKANTAEIATPDVGYFEDNGDVNIESGGDFCAPYNPAVLTKGCLELNKVVQSTGVPSWKLSSSTISLDRYYFPALYYVYSPDKTAADTDCDSEDSGEALSTNEKCYVEYVIAATAVDFSTMYGVDDDRLYLFTDGGDDGFNTVTGKRKSKITYPGSNSRTDCIDTSACTYEEELQNFANWFTYYRSRVLTQKAEVGAAVSGISNTYRVGFTTTNSSSLVKGVEPFEGAYKENFLEKYIYYDDADVTPVNWSWTDADPLAASISQVGGYFEAESDYDVEPWANTPHISGDESSSGWSTNAKTCRRSFNLLFTDADDDTTSYSGGVTLKSVAKLYFDNDLQSYIDSDLQPIKYNTNSIIDLYGEDLAEEQHMSNFIVALYNDGSVVAAGKTIDYLSLEDSVSVVSSPSHLQELFNVAISTGGQIYTSGVDVVNAIDIVQDLNGQTMLSGSSVALNSGSLFEGSTLYQAVFDATTWSGEIKAYSIKTNGILSASPIAISEVPSDETLRVIATYGCKLSGSPAKAICEPVTFDFSSDQDADNTANLGGYYLTTSLNDKLIDVITDPTDTGSVSASNKKANIKWLRGDTTNDSSSTYRDRDGNLLGDIVHSSPVFVGEPNSPYYNWDESLDEYLSSYDEFRLNQSLCDWDSDDSGYDFNSCRYGMLYVGANDGMLHMFKVWDEDADGFDDSIDEIAAYVPNAVIAQRNLNELYKPYYDHTYYVDSTPSVGDAFIDPDVTDDADGDGKDDNDKEWQTLLVGGLGAGGKGIYAINITNPNQLDTIDGLKERIMWEYSAVDDPDDMGFTYSKPSIVRFPNNKWVAVFGNGYNSKNGDACLIAIDLETGGSNYAQKSCSSPSVPVSSVTYKNGLSSVTPVDTDGDFIVDYVYGGDLYGNLYRFDVADSGGISNSTIFSTYFETVTGDGLVSHVQPITSRPQVLSHPTVPGGLMVYFGTGKYLDAKDREFSSTTRERQTFYAIWDRFEGDSITRSNLQQQKILTDVVYFNVSGTLTPFDLRVTSDTGTSGKDYWYGTSEDPENPDVYGWYLDLYNTFNSNEYTYGERQITDSIILNGKIIFTTTIPDVEICNVNSSGWLMELDAETGNPLKDSVFDANNDGLIDYKDALYSSVERGDLSTPEVPLSGKKSTVGILSAPGILSDFSNSNAAKEFKYMSGSSGKIQAIRENPDAAGQAGYGRKSWRQLFR